MCVRNGHDESEVAADLDIAPIQLDDDEAVTRVDSSACPVRDRALALQGSRGASSADDSRGSAPGVLPILLARVES